MILDAEIAILAAVRTRLMETIGIVADEIDIELDDVAPGMAGQTYYAISANGCEPGKHSTLGDQTTHNLFGVRVAVIERITDVARDRRRTTAFIDRLRSINGKLSQVSRFLRYSYETINLANIDLASGNIDGKFIKPLVPKSCDQKPRLVQSEMYGAKSTSTGGDLVVAMVRGINFGGAEFIGRVA